MSDIENHVDEDGDKSEVVVTEAMIEAGIALLDEWLCLNLREMREEGHTGHSKDSLVRSVLLQCCSK